MKNDNEALDGTLDADAQHFMKRSRWGSRVVEPGATPAARPASSEDPVKKRSRWGAKTKEPDDPLLIAVQLGIPLATLQNMPQAQAALLPDVKQRCDELDLLLRLPDCGVSDMPEDQRSPSPEPIFDRNGAVVNGRVSRRRKHLEEEKQKALDLLKPKVPQRQWRKLIVPVDKYPGYNFFGALIGPRGNAQKRMERESGCKIVIRGRGAIKEGCGRHDGKPLGPEDEEPMHVLIEGPDEETVERGQAIVEVVLNPYSQEAIECKEKQMKELAIINGTLKDEDSSASNWTQAAAKGALFHNRPALPLPPSSGIGLPPPPSSLDDEYASFMTELNGTGGEGRPSRPAPGLPSGCDGVALMQAAPWARSEAEGGIGCGVGASRPSLSSTMTPPPWASGPSLHVHAHAQMHVRAGADGVGPPPASTFASPGVAGPSRTAVVPVPPPPMMIPPGKVLLPPPPAPLHAYPPRPSRDLPLPSHLLGPLSGGLEAPPPPSPGSDDPPPPPPEYERWDMPCQ